MCRQEKTWIMNASFASIQVEKRTTCFFLPSLIDVVNQYSAWNTSVSCGEIREALWVTSLSALWVWSEWVCAPSACFTATFFSLQVLFLKGMPFLHYLEPKQSAVYFATMTQKTGRNVVFLFKNVNSSLFPVARSSACVVWERGVEDGTALSLFGPLCFCLETGVVLKLTSCWESGCQVYTNTHAHIAESPVRLFTSFYILSFFSPPLLFRSKASWKNHTFDISCCPRWKGNNDFLCVCVFVHAFIHPLY